jgi:hypothetical protein
MDDFREDGIRKAVEIGGRVNGASLLNLAAAILRGKATPSPALADWFTSAVDAIFDGASADVAFDVRRKQGPDPIATVDRNLARDGRILDLVNAARRDGYLTGGNRERPSCFELVAEQLGLPEKTVRTVYYEWETVVHDTCPDPEAE